MVGFFMIPDRMHYFVEHMDYSIVFLAVWNHLNF